jgi:hypothetical protein
MEADRKRLTAGLSLETNKETKTTQNRKEDNTMGSFFFLIFCCCLALLPVGRNAGAVTVLLRFNPRHFYRQENFDFPYRLAFSPYAHLL